jgi:pilus assembly protein CpaB
MLVRNLLLLIGGLALFAGIVLSVIWLRQPVGPVQDTQQAARVRPAILVAAEPIAVGTLLRDEDLKWKDVAAAELRPGLIVRGQTSEADFVGAVARRAFRGDEPLIAADLVKPNERGFLAEVLKPGMRAVAIFVDPSQSASGLIVPGDRVDVILTQNFPDASDPARKLVGETVLRDVRAIAVDQSLRGGVKPSAIERRIGPAESQLPKTVTLELSARQAEILLVAAQLGKLGLSVRALEGSGSEPADMRRGPPVWASDVSPALKDTERKAAPYTSGSTVEKSLRVAPPAGTSTALPSTTGGPTDRPAEGAHP